MQTTQTACFWLRKVLGSFGKYAWLQADFSWSFMFSESKFQIFGQRSQGRRFHQLPLREQHFVLSLAGLVIVPSLVSGTAQEIIFGQMGRPWKARTCDHVRNQLGDDRQVLFYWHHTFDTWWALSLFADTDSWPYDSADEGQSEVDN